jgi:hypothetical protein
VIIAGSRGIRNKDVLERAIFASTFPVDEVVTGGARGVDQLAVVWAKLNDVPYRVMKADWNRHGKAAGAIRNVEMARHADALIAVWDGESRGTKHMIQHMEALDKPVFVWRTSND